METNLQKLTKIIQEAVPEIMELKRGCDILDEKGYRNVLIKQANKEYLWHTLTDIIQVSKIKEILGRDITLEDVLIAIEKKKKDILIDNEGCFCKREKMNEFDRVCPMGWKADWQLNKPLHEQTKETIDFLLEILE